MVKCTTTAKAATNININNIAMLQTTHHHRSCLLHFIVIFSNHHNINNMFRHQHTCLMQLRPCREWKRTWPSGRARTWQQLWMSQWACWLSSATWTTTTTTHNRLMHSAYAMQSMLINNWNIYSLALIMYDSFIQPTTLLNSLTYTDLWCTKINYFILVCLFWFSTVTVV